MSNSVIQTSTAIEEKNYKDRGSTVYNFSIHYPLIQPDELNLEEIISPIPTSITTGDFILKINDIKPSILGSTLYLEQAYNNEKIHYKNKIIYIISIINTIAVYKEQISNVNHMYNLKEIFSINMLVLQQLFTLETLLDRKRKTRLEELSLEEASKIILFVRPKIYNLLYNWGVTPKSLNKEILTLIKKHLTDPEDIEPEQERKDYKYAEFIKNLILKTDRIQKDYATYFLRILKSTSNIDPKHIPELLPENEDTRRKLITAYYKADKRNTEEGL